MKKEEISNMINNIDDGFIAEAASYTEENSNKNKIVKTHRFFKTGSGMVAAIAVCVIMWLLRSSYSEKLMMRPLKRCMFR